MRFFPIFFYMKPLNTWISCLVAKLPSLCTLSFLTFAVWAKLMMEWPHQFRVFGSAVLRCPCLSLSAPAHCFSSGVTHDISWMTTTQLQAFVAGTLQHRRLYLLFQQLTFFWGYGWFCSVFWIIMSVFDPSTHAWGFTWHFRTKLVTKTMVIWFERWVPLACPLKEYAQEASQSFCETALVCIWWRRVPVICWQIIYTFQFYDWTQFKDLLFQGRKVKLILLYP